MYYYYQYNFALSDRCETTLVIFYKIIKKCVEFMRAHLFICCHQYKILLDSRKADMFLF